jgi:hypothetical protein
MSYTTITQATTDQPLLNRVTAAIQKEAYDNAALSDTDFGSSAKADPYWASQRMIWPVAIDTEAAYESALINDNPNPGGDPSVITDAAILTSVQANWPPDAPLDNSEV